MTINTIFNNRYTLIPVVGFLTAMLFQSTVMAQVGYLDKGDKVRVYAPSIEYDMIYGIIYDMTPIAIYLNSNNFSLAVPIYTIQSLELHNGVRRNTGPGALIGTLSGAAFGGIIGLISYEECEESFCINFSPGFHFLGGAAVGGLSGLVIGAIIGYWVKSDRWKKIPININIGFNSLPYADATLSPGFNLKRPLYFTH